MDALYMEGVEKSFGPVKALKGLSMSVPVGAVCGFIGPNGAGKTTAIRLLLGLIPKDRGVLRVLGEEVEFGRDLGVRRRLAYLPQDPVFPERHSGQEVMSLAGELYGMDRAMILRRTDALLQEFHLEHARRQSVATYSRGMKQRLGLAVSFLPEPELLVLDEPVSSLDPEGRREVFDILRRLRGKSTVFFSSHILDDVERVSDLLVMLKDGEKVLEGAMGEVLSRYAPDRLRIGFRPADVVRACEALRGLPWVSRVAGGEENGVVYVDVAPTQIEAAVEETLVHLVRQGFRVREYSRSGADLEGVFLRIAESAGTAGSRDPERRA